MRAHRFRYAECARVRARLSGMVSPSTDTVGMPSRTLRFSEAYYSTLFHELTHSTGHAFQSSGRNREAKTRSLRVLLERRVNRKWCSDALRYRRIERKTLSNSAAYLRLGLTYSKPILTWSCLPIATQKGSRLHSRGCAMSTLLSHFLNLSRRSTRTRLLSLSLGETQKILAKFASAPYRRVAVCRLPCRQTSMALA